MTWVGSELCRQIFKSFKFLTPSRTLRLSFWSVVATIYSLTPYTICSHKMFKSIGKRWSMLVNLVTPASLLRLGAVKRGQQSERLRAARSVLETQLASAPACDHASTTIHDSCKWGQCCHSRCRRGESQRGRGGCRSSCDSGIQPQNGSQSQRRRVNLCIVADDERPIDIDVLQIHLDAVRMCCRLVDTPASELHTQAFVELARETAATVGAEISVLEGVARTRWARRHLGCWESGQSHPPALLYSNMHPMVTRRLSAGWVRASYTIQAG